jgi:hypothetical protein
LQESSEVLSQAPLPPLPSEIQETTNRPMQDADSNFGRSRHPSQAIYTLNQPTPDITMHTFCAQLTFGLPPSPQINVADHFLTWLETSFKHLKTFSLLPFDDANQDPPITSITQLVPDNPTFFGTYFHNHRILQHGNLTGVVTFQTSTLWWEIKSFKSNYFNWL